MTGGPGLHAAIDAAFRALFAGEDATSVFALLADELGRRAPPFDGDR